LSSVEIQAVIIADWQGLAMASKLPEEDLDKEELIAATTLFSLTGAEDTRKELQETLLGKKLSYLLMMTEGGSLGLTPYMVVCPISNLGYIACVSNKREDMAIMIMNMKQAAEKASDVLGPHQEAPLIQQMTPAIDKVKSFQDSPEEEGKYNEILGKIRNLRNIQVSSYTPPSGLKREGPPTIGSPALPEFPAQAAQTKFKSIPTQPVSSPAPPVQTANPPTQPVQTTSEPQPARSTGQIPSILQQGMR